MIFATQHKIPGHNIVEENPLASGSDVLRQATDDNDNDDSDDLDDNEDCVDEGDIDSLCQSLIILLL